MQFIDCFLIYTEHASSNLNPKSKMNAKFRLNIQLSVDYAQGRIQDFAQGGGQNGREAPENFFVPPLSSSGGGQGGDSPPP